MNDLKLAVRATLLKVNRLPSVYFNDPDAENYLDSVVEAVFYAAISVIFLMIIALMVKLLWDWDEGREARITETSGLLSTKVQGWLVSYGTGKEEDDIEESIGKRSCSSSSDDLYDGKICVICYDDQRSCLFIPCGHCITCFNCANRIIGEESKSCPICRSFIDKVRKLHIL